MTFKTALATLARRHPTGSRWLALRSLSRESHLRASGWFESFRRGVPLDANGDEIPWYTYGAIRFLESRVGPSLSVFEFGSGHSTLWWSRRVARVVACENDRHWFELMRPRLPPSVRYIHDEASSGGSYAQQVVTVGEAFDIVVIDGRDRLRCAEHALAALRPTGVVVWDNSDRPEYEPGYAMLARHGFRRLDFWGMGPINTYEWCTSVFYRSENCLAL